ncbi:hypothetical protein Bca52824_005235 [Brassica carinata]|uniref:Uncharacterized protein n=1 Tax=Brassica carinata TaxID=52824 RepID=A0A8X7WRJ7_BRACI|nr:hypothetical protein Bca52824_005235 [Brassica carinata]
MANAEGLEEKYEAYFLPRKPWPKALAFYGSFILGGIGAGMLIETWINKRSKKMEESFGNSTSKQTQVMDQRLYTASRICILCTVGSFNMLPWSHDQDHCLFNGGF